MSELPIREDSNDRTGRVVYNDTDRYHFFLDGKTCDDRCMLVTDMEAVRWIWGGFARVAQDMARGRSDELKTEAEWHHIVLFLRGVPRSLLLRLDGWLQKDATDE